MQPYSVSRKEVEEVIGRAKYVVAIAVPVFLVSFFFVPVHWPSLAGGIALGFVGFVGVIASWRWYHPWVSWLVWALPVSGGFGFLLGQYGINGEASITNLFGQALWGGMVVFFGLLWLLQRSVMRWIG
jgi:hypothetical protein